MPLFTEIESLLSRDVPEDQQSEMLTEALELLQRAQYLTRMDDAYRDWAQHGGSGCIRCFRTEEVLRTSTDNVTIRCKNCHREFEIPSGLT
jgi:hypothetical protein